MTSICVHPQQLLLLLSQQLTNTLNCCVGFFLVHVRLPKVATLQVQAVLGADELRTEQVAWWLFSA
jgi:hypothetical protein